MVFSSRAAVSKHQPSCVTARRKCCSLPIRCATLITSGWLSTSVPCARLSSISWWFALMERWNAEEAVDLIDRHGLAMTISATTFLQELLDAAERKGTRLPSLKVFACGGASVPLALVRRANSSLENCRAFRVYGATEVPLIGRGCVDPGDDATAADTDGIIVDFEVRITGDRGDQVPDGVEGEILARGPA